MIGPMEAANVTHDADRRTYTVAIEVADTYWREIQSGIVGIVQLERSDWSGKMELVFTDLHGTVVPLPPEAYAWR